MYTPNYLAKLISFLRHENEIFRQPPDLLEVEQSENPPKLDEFKTKSEFYNDFLFFCEDYDKAFKLLSPYGVSCLRKRVQTDLNNISEISTYGFKTYNEILWDIYHIDLTLKRGRDWKLCKPPPGLDFSIENEINWP